VRLVFVMSRIREETAMFTKLSLYNDLRQRRVILESEMARKSFQHELLLLLLG